MSTEVTSPCVSVVIPSHNRANFILDALRAAFAQGPAILEVIVVDDGSSDNTLDVLRNVKDPRLRVFSQKQSGPAAARNHGWREARGEWIAFLDSDDGLADGAINALLAAAASHPGAIPFGAASVHGQTVDSPAVYSFNFAHRSGNLLQELCFYSSGTILSCLFPKRVLEAVGGFGESDESHYCEDFDFALRIALRYEFAHVPQVCYKIRMHDGNRHRPQHRLVWLSSLACVRRRLSNAPRYWLLKQRAKAYYRNLVADYDRETGDRANAIRGYVQSILWWPIKLGAWKGLARALFSSPSPQTSGDHKAS